MRSSSFLLLLSLAACGGSDDPGRGDVVTELPDGVESFALASDGDALVAALLYTQAPPETAVRLARIEDGKVVRAPLPPNVAWHDVAEGLSDGKDAWTDVRISGDSAYFLGFYGVTVLALDGSSVRHLFRPSWEEFAIGGDEATGADDKGFTKGGFAVDDGVVYVAYEHGELGRFRVDGTYESLATVGDEAHITGDSVVVSSDAVYFAAGQDVQRWRKSDRSLSVVWHSTNGDPFRLAFGGSTLYVETLGDGGGVLAAVPAADGPVVTLETFQPSSPASLGLAADDAHVYRLTQIDLRRYAPGGGSEILAQRPPPPGGSFVGLAVAGSRVFFSDGNEGADGVVRTTLRSVAR